MTSPWFCLLQDFQNLFGTHWPNFAMAEVGFVFFPLGQRGQWQIGTKFIEVLSSLEIHCNFSDFHWIFKNILFFIMRNSGFSKKALKGQFTNYCWNGFFNHLMSFSSDWFPAYFDLFSSNPASSLGSSEDRNYPVPACGELWERGSILRRRWHPQQIMALPSRHSQAQFLWGFPPPMKDFYFN